ncbi:excalibur calcium-binding domain-containing protein [Streptomyces sp. NPDC017248]|uniref:excalibur calcium-binding domain-containing protein n=1 Tax=unclassified Streptomyces TaxID=2593676 RepID=UPI0037B6CC6F
MTNPYTTPPAPRSPRWARKRYLLPALGLTLFAGVGIGAAGEDTAPRTEPAAAAPHPTVTVTATATATQTAAPEPAPTVTRTHTVKVKVRVTHTVTAEPAADTGTDTSAGVYYANCTEARAAGVTPLHTGDPGYDGHLDRDGDGVACE